MITIFVPRFRSCILSHHCCFLLIYSFRRGQITCSSPCAFSQLFLPKPSVHFVTMSTGPSTGYLQPTSQKPFLCFTPSLTCCTKRPPGIFRNLPKLWDPTRSASTDHCEHGPFTRLPIILSTAGNSGKVLFVSSRQARDHQHVA